MLTTGSLLMPLVGFLKDDNNTQIVIEYRITQDMKKYPPPPIILAPLWQLLFPFRQPIQITLPISAGLVPVSNGGIQI